MKKILILIISSFLILCACEDVLEKKPLDTITDAVLWGDPILMDDYLTQCYSELRFYFNMPYGKGINDLMNNYALEAITLSDECQPIFWGVPGNKSSDITIKGGIFEWWGYPTIRSLNIFIDKLNALNNLSESYKKQRLAEARFLRAFAYFNMVERYGGIPLITKVQQLNDPPEELYPKRDKEEDIYQFIISELDAIANDLQENWGDGRATKYAALALKSRAAMYAASIAQWGKVQLDGVVGIPSDKASNYWQICYDASKSIINSGKFALYNKYPNDKAKNYRNLFLDENNSEVIFAQRFDGKSGIGHIWDMLNVPRSYHVWNSGQHCGLYFETLEWYDYIDGTPGIIDRNKLVTDPSKVEEGHLWTVDELWGKKDPRFKASCYTTGTPWIHKQGPFVLDYHYAILTPDGQLLTEGLYKGVLCQSQNGGTPYGGVLKYLDEEFAIDHERNFSKTDYIIFRLGEILLNYAEASFELNKPNDALWAVNEIRKRAGMPEYTSIDREKIRKERRVELAFEGTRYFDIRRWRTALDDLNKDFHGLLYVLDGSSIVEGKYDILNQKFYLFMLDKVAGDPGPYFAEKHYYLPISLSRTGNNKNLVENPGYE